MLREEQSASARIVRVIVDDMLPYITPGNGSGRFGGYLGEIWHIMEINLHFQTVPIALSYDEGIELISNGGADVMLAAVVPKEGSENIEYSQPYFYNWYHMYMKQPVATVSSSSYLRTLNRELWFASLAQFAVFTCLLWFTLKIINRYTKLQNLVSIPSCLLASCAGFLNQGSDISIFCISGRMQWLFAMLFGYMLYTSMSAVLVAQLANFNIELPFENLQDLMKYKTYSLCLRNNSFVYNFFVDDDKEILPSWEKILNGPGCLDIVDQSNLAKIICQDNIVILENRVVISNIVRLYSLPCVLAFVKTALFTKPNTFIMHKDFRYKEDIKIFMRQLQSYGLLQRIEHEWIGKTEPHMESVVATSQVTLLHIAGILFLLLSMMLISLLILLLEKVFRRYLEVENSKSAGFEFVK